MNGFSGALITTLNLAGNFDMRGGTFDAVLVTATGVQVWNFNNTSNKTYEVSGGTFTSGGLITFNVN
jgi:hypothetical protein